MSFKTPDRFPGPREEEEVILDDRDSDGDPTVSGAIRRLNTVLRYRSTVLEQILTARNFPADFLNVNLLGLNDGDLLAYDSTFKEFRPAAPSTSGSHEDLDTLTHQIVEDSFDEITRSCTGPKGRITNITTWNQELPPRIKIRETQITRISGKVSQVIDIQYDPIGVELYRVTEDITRVNGVVSSITRIRI